MKTRSSPPPPAQRYGGALLSKLRALRELFYDAWRAGSVSDRRIRFRPALEGLEARVLMAYNVALSSSATAAVSFNETTGIYTATGSGANVNVTDLWGKLDSYSTVIINTGAGGSEDGNINWNSGNNLVFNGIGGSKTLRFEATSGTVGAVTLSSNIADSSPGSESLTVQTDSKGPVTINGSISTGGGNVSFQTLGAISQGANSIIIAAHLAVASVGGATLTNETADNNEVEEFSAINSGSGNIELTNNAEPLTITAMSQSGGGDILIDNYGDINSTNWTGIQNTATISASDSGCITLHAISAGRVEVYAPVTTTGSGDIYFTTENGYGILLYSNLTSGTGNIIITSSYRIEFFGGASITTNGNVTLMAEGAYIRQNEYGTISANLLTATSLYEMTLNNANSVASFSATNGASGNVSLVNTAPTLTLLGITQAVGTTSITNTGEIVTTGSVGGTSVALNSSSMIALGANVTASGTGGSVTLNPSAGGVTQTAGTVTAPKLLLTGAGSFSLPNTAVGTVAADILDSIVLHSNSAVTVGSVGSVAGIATGDGSTPGGDVAINAPEGITVNEDISTASGSGGWDRVGDDVDVNADLTLGAGDITLRTVTPQAIDEALMTEEDIPLNTYWLTYNDRDPDLYVLSLIAVTQAEHGSVVIEEDGTVTYTPDEEWSGTDSFDYTITDGYGGYDTGTATVAITAVNDPPVADDIGESTNLNMPLAVTLTGSDVEGEGLTFEIFEPPEFGTLGELDGDTITFYPAGKFSGTDTFTYYVHDGVLASEAATVTITVNSATLSAGVRITQSSGSTKVNEQGLLEVPGYEGDFAESDTYTVVLNTQPSASVVITIDPGDGLAVDEETLTFTTSNWNVAQTVTVTAPNDHIAAGDRNVAITHSAASSDSAYNNVAIASVTVALTDSDFVGVFPDPGAEPEELNEVGTTSTDLEFSLTSMPSANVVVTLTPDADVSLSASSLTFTSTNWDTPQTVTVTAVNDSAAEGYDDAVVAITTASSDSAYDDLEDEFAVMVLDSDGPNALPDAVVTDQDTEFNFDPSDNDIDPNSYTLTITSVTQGEHGSVDIEQDGTLTYTPDGDYSGEDSFTYTVSDGHGGSTMGDVYVWNKSVNHAPFIGDPGTPTTQTDTRVSLQMTATDPEQNAILWSAENLPPGLVIKPMSGEIFGWIHPAAWQEGSFTVTVYANDLNGGIGYRTFTWIVNKKNHDPHMEKGGGIVAYVGDSIDWESGGIVYQDVDGDDVSFTVEGLPPGISYDPEENEFSGTFTTRGTYWYTVTASDGDGGTDKSSAPVYVVTPEDDGPVPIAIIYLGDTSQGFPMMLGRGGTAITGAVYLGSPDEFTEYTVTLRVTPGGLATVSPSSFTMRSGDIEEFTLTPNGVSQKLTDGMIHVYVGGRETAGLQFTNVDVVLPENPIKGPDTPVGMLDRISVGGGNWGTYYGKVQVYPMLYGLDVIGFGVAAPNNNPEYGVAAAVAPFYNVLNTSVMMVAGLSQTSPPASEEAPLNAPFLQVVAHLAPQPALQPPVLGQQRFAVAAIPIAVQVVGAQPRRGMDRGTAWGWGVMYDLLIVSDGGQLLGISIKERTGILDQTGVFEGARNQEGGWAVLDPSHNLLFDFVALEYSKAQYTLASAAKRFAQTIRLDGHLVAIQDFEYYSDVMGSFGPEPRHVIRNSGFIHALNMVHNRRGLADGPDAMAVNKLPFAWGAARRGLMKKPTDGVFHIQ